ncbi:MAG: heme ABC transporter permease CcmC [Paracoccaceae bacterium]|nr:heme ABC transporter permease CcmC [Paracoccaceae bacterium]
MHKSKRSIWEIANPKRFVSISGKLIPLLAIVTIFSLGLGVSWGIFFTPNDFRQGSAVKIIYIHVPSAFLAINIYIMMLITSIIWLVRRHHVSLLAAKAAAPIGLTMTLVAILTGAIWGKPIWGTYWVWDPRLTSFAILLMFYIGYISIWSALEYNEKVGDLSALLCIIGSIFALLSRYAVLFWSQGLHQGASLSLDKEENISNVFYLPLLVCLFGFFSLFLTLLLIRTRTEIRIKRMSSLMRRNSEK